MFEAVMQNRWREIIFRSDVMVAFGLVLVLMLMILPVPPILLDLFLSMNITMALLILVISLYTVRALDFAIFPSVLLVTTLFRLSLNVASTRLILLHGDEGVGAAGTVIESFGQFVVGGNYVVGLVIFIILVIINFMVITKGAGRVAEVAARFTLDAMPGKQMAIDADLNAGMITETDARKRREDIAQEADFYGAMDGASKFVKGDAIAGIIITLINIGAGFVIGVLQKDMPMADAAANYTILTVGDGLVGQIPALIISTGAGIMVTRTASDEDFGSEAKRQFSIHPRAIWVVAAILGAFALIPGLPQIPFLLMAGLLCTIAWRIQQTQEKELLEVEELKALPAAPVEENYEAMLSVDLLEMEVGYGLIPLVDAGQNGELLPRIKSIRKQFALDMGFIVPPVHIKDNLQLKPNEYAIILKGVKIGSGELLPDHYLAMNPGTATETLKGIETVEPAFGLPAIWIGDDKKERAQIAGYTVVDNITVIATHISELIRTNCHELLGRQEAQNLLDNLAQDYPKLIEELLPNLLSLGVVMRVLQNLLRERVSIRDLRTILETLADWAPTVHDPDQLTEHVRQVLARSISSQFSMDGSMLEVMTLERGIENRLQDAMHVGEQGAYLAIEPGFAQTLISGLKKMSESFPSGNPVLLCTPGIRIHVRRLTERYLPSLTILSHNEIAPHLKVRSVGTVTVDAH